MTKYEFLERARDMHGYKYEYPYLGDKILSQDNITVLYNGVEYTQKVVKHILLGRCPEKSTSLKTTSDFIRDARKIWGNKYDYSLVDYKGALDKVKIIYNGSVYEQIATSHLKYAPQGTDICNNKVKISKILDNYNIAYLKQYKFDDWEGIFDFYIPSIRTIIEYDNKVNDKIKDDYCEDNYIELVRISYEQVDNIEEILKNYIIK
jgi:hypothetical protein